MELRGNPHYYGSIYNLADFIPKYTNRNQTNITHNESLNVVPKGQAYWFSYISLLTVGLGDFYLTSELLFMSDVFIWELLFLVGFTFLSTFLGQLTDMISNSFPDSGSALTKRLMNTKLVKKKEIQFKKENLSGIEKLEKLVEIMDNDNKKLVADRVTRIRVKQNILVHLLYQTKIEMDHYERRGERHEHLSYAKVVQEENMLSEVLSETKKEREDQERYRRTEVSEFPPPGSARNKSYLDGPEFEDVARKLKLRTGKKSVKKRMAPSTYI